MAFITIIKYWWKEGGERRGPGEERKGEGRKGRERGEREKDPFGCLTRVERAHAFKKTDS